MDFAVVRTDPALAELEAVLRQAAAQAPAAAEELRQELEPDRRVEILTLWHGSRREPRLPG